jgi:hypothetical protein
MIFLPKTILPPFTVLSYLMSILVLILGMKLDILSLFRLISGNLYVNINNFDIQYHTMTSLWQKTLLDIVNNK